MGLQARAIVVRLDPDQMWHAFTFAGGVLTIVVVVRLAWVLFFNRMIRLVTAIRGGRSSPSVAQGLVVSWCGMRELVTLATALALPSYFPARDLILLSALAVVLGTLIIQGLTLGPLIRWLRFEPDDSFCRELSSARVALLDAAIASLVSVGDEAARRLRDAYRAERGVASDGHHPRAVTEIDQLRRHSIVAKT